MGIGKMKMALWGQRWPAPAKINLMLRIVGRRADGYHLLQTVFQIIDYCDYLQFYPRNDDKIVLESPLEGVSDDDNLAVRAARLLRDKARDLCVDISGVTISIDKNIPMGGGLGGGSSDAATTLVVLNTLWNLQLSDSEIASMGLQLGADVPVFIYGNSAWAEGVGESLDPIELPHRWYLMLVPECHVNTGEIFNRPELTRNSESITISEFSPVSPYNDCLPVVVECYPQVKQALSVLSNYPVHGLTGTGGCVYASFESEVETLAAARSLKECWNVIVAKAVNRSPLHQMLLTGE